MCTRQLVITLAVLCMASAQSALAGDNPSTPPSGQFYAGTPTEPQPQSRSWPVNLHLNNAGFSYTPGLYDINNDGAAEIFLTGGYTFGLKGDGTFLPGWPTTEMYAMGYGTTGCLPAPSFADFDEDGSPDVMWMLRDWWYGSGLNRLDMWMFNGKKADGTNLLSFPQNAPGIVDNNGLGSSFVLGDVLENGHLEAWGFHTLGNNFDFNYISAYDHTGARKFTIYLPDMAAPQSVQNLYFGDIDGNGHKEMFAVSYSNPSYILHVFNPDGTEQAGYPIVLHTFDSGWLMNGAPVAVDLDGDGDLELLFGYWNGSADSYMICKHHDGTMVTGFPFLMHPRTQLYSIRLGDVTGDSKPEIIVLDNNLDGGDRINVYDTTWHQQLPGFPLELPYWIFAYPTIADVDGDGRQDILVGADDQTDPNNVVPIIFGVNGSGQTLAGFPKTLNGSATSGCAVGDIDGDGLFEVVNSTWHGYVWAWDTPAPARANLADWPVYGGNARSTGVYGDRQCTQLGTVWFERQGYNCSGTASVRVLDCGLNTNSLTIQTTTVKVASTTNPGGQIITLTETAPDSAYFVGSIALGTLPVSPGDTLTATYTDADNGIGGHNVAVTGQAIVDCQPAGISNVQVQDVLGTSASVTFTTSEAAQGSVRFGAACGGLNLAAGAPGFATAHSIKLTGLLPEHTYYFAAVAEDAGGNITVENNAGTCYSFTTPPAPIYFTELFTPASPPDLANRSIKFTPNQSLSKYDACIDTIAALPTDPTGGTPLNLEDDAFATIDLTTPFSFYGVPYTTMYVGNNGYITFGGGDSGFVESLEAHFAMPRIAALFDDFRVGDVSWKQLPDRVAVTWPNMMDWTVETGDNTCQIELFNNGTIRMSYLSLAATHALAGLSAGNGVPADFLMTDLTSLPPCGLRGDMNCDGAVDFKDINPFVAILSGGTPCNAANADCNGDGVIDFKDINPFVALLSGN
jgi:hypothetical protein